MPTQAPEIVALIPAAGKGTRLGGLPCSKELIPLTPGKNDNYVAPAGARVAIEDCLHMLAENDVMEAYIVMAPGKKDIAAYLGDGHSTGVRIAYLSLESSPSVPHTLSVAIPHIEGRVAVLVFPDIVFHPRNAIKLTAERHARTGADVTLALVPSDRGDKVDIVATDANDRVVQIVSKPGVGYGGWTWIAAIWGARFSTYLHEHVGHKASDGDRELFVSDVLNAARSEDFVIDGLRIKNGKALDIGTPEDLQTLWKRGL